jgi:SAM-dependent methyltransferase
LDYHRFHAERAAQLIEPAKARILVVGCSHGRECGLFAELGAAEVHGVDVAETIGRDFAAAVYHRASITDCPLESGRFDLVYAVAVMEHVGDLNAAFAEMARLTKSGGVVYSVAAPLWHAPFGHHYAGMVRGHPWLHLRYDEAGFEGYCRAHGLEAPEGKTIDGVARYIYRSPGFNRHKTGAYKAAADRLDGAMEPITHDFGCVDRAMLTRRLRMTLWRYREHDLLASTHRYIARKI